MKRILIALFILCCLTACQPTIGPPPAAARNRSPFFPARRLY